MLHVGELAAAPYALLSLASLATGVLFTLAVIYRLHRAGMLVGSAMFVLLALWFALLTISAGPSPILLRSQVTSLLRWLAAAISAFWFCWLAFCIWGIVRVERR